MSSQMNNKGQNNLKCAELKGRKDNSHNIIAIQRRIVVVFFFTQLVLKGMQNGVTGHSRDCINTVFCLQIVS